MSAFPNRLTARFREPRSSPEGLLVVFHGRGADEHDLFPLLDLVDPEHRLLAVAPRGPLSLPPGGAHWYEVREIGHPDTATFQRAYELASAWLRELAEWSGVHSGRTILGGFSQGAVMAYALGLGSGQPRPAGLLALSGFMPTVDGLRLDLEERPAPRVAVGHGSFDPVIGVEWGRRARDTLTEAGIETRYREAPLPHAIDPGFVREASSWLMEALDERRRSSASEAS